MFETSRGTNFMQRRQGAKAERLLRKAVVSYFINCAFAPLHEIRFLASALGFLGGGCKKASVAKKGFS
jgi:hypothetical protein